MAYKVTLNASNISELVVEDENIKKIRASYYLIGALLEKLKHAEVALPAAVISAVVPLTTHQGFTCPGCGGEDRAWTDQGHASIFSWQSYLYGCGQRWCYHQYHDGRCNGTTIIRIHHHYREFSQRALSSAWYRVYHDPQIRSK